MTARHEAEWWRPEITPIEGCPLVIVSSAPWMEPGDFLVTSRHHAEHMHHEPYMWEWASTPGTVKSQAIKIVHDGLADWVAYLREQGHDIPTWEERERREEDSFTFEVRAEASLRVMNPRASTVVTDAV